jgi:phage protein D/phage baseplate assembly protein gpV
MPEAYELASQISITIDGNDVQPDVMGHVLSVEVDQHAHVPDMFTLRIQDINFGETGSIIDEGPFDLTKEIEIAAETGEGERVSLMQGEITALEPEFQEGMIARLVVRGYDKSHRLYREVKSKAHLNKKDSDLASEIAQAAGLQADVETTQAVYEHIFQHNQSDLAFLHQRARRIGYECFVADGKLVFRSPPTGSGELTLRWGQDLLTFRPRMTLAEQVDEVVVRGWDVNKKEAIVGRAQQGQLYPQIQESKDGATWAQAFGTGKQILVRQPVGSQSEADTLAAARLDEISGAFVQAEGEALRRPDIRAGRMVTLEALGDRFSGTYLITGARHTYSAEGLKTQFSVRGTRTGLLAGSLGLAKDEDRWSGIVPAVVTNTDDPQNWGRVKVEYPWLTENAESHWARVMGAGAGPEAGLYVMPEVGDEVLVAFAMGSFEHPYVLGGVWNGQHDIPPEPSGAGSGEKPLVRTWRSRTGHAITVYDNADNKIEIVTSGGQKLVLDDANGKIEITSSGGMTMAIDDQGSQITLQGTNIEIVSDANLKVEASANIDIEAGAQLTLKGAIINLNP